MYYEPDVIIFETKSRSDPTCRALRKNVIPRLKGDGVDVREIYVESANSGKQIHWYRNFCDRNVGVRITPVARVGDSGILDRKPRDPKKKAEVLGDLIRKKLEEKENDPLPPRDYPGVALRHEEEPPGGLYRV